MNIQKHNKHIFVVILLVLSLYLTACGASVEKLNMRGNEAYARKMYDEALVAYQAAQIESPELAEPYYNAANALYRQGNYAEAVKQLGHALSFADEETIKQSGLYNLGNNAFNNQELETAVEAYKNALLIDAKDQDAKYNLELALQQQEQQQQEQEQQENQEQNQDQESDGEEPQENDNQNGEGDNQQDQSQSEDEKNQEAESSEDQPGGQGQNTDQSEQQNEDNQADQGDQSEQDQGEDQPQDQDGDVQDQKGQDGQIPAPGQRMTAEQAEQLLAAIAQNMETLQERLGQVLFIQELPPAQDW